MHKSLRIACAQACITMCTTPHLYPRVLAAVKLLGINIEFTHTIHSFRTQAYPQATFIIQSVIAGLYTVSTQLIIGPTNLKERYL